MRRLIGTVIVLVAVLALVDRVTVLYAEHRVGLAVRNTEHLSNTPTVKIHGFPFLTQLAGEKFGDVEVIVRDFAPPHAVAFDKIDVHLRDARVHLGDVATGTASRVPTRRIDGTATIAFGALNRVHEGLSFGPAGNGGIKVSGGVSVAGQTTQASITGRMRLVNNALEIAVDGVNLAHGAPSTAISSIVSKAIAVSTDLPSLPFHFRVTSVRVTAKGVEVSGSADNVTLSAS
jgi:hypothetical protein